MLRSALFLLLYCTVQVDAQTYLRITKTSPGRIRVTEVYPHTKTVYKSAGERFRKAQLIAMRDSMLFFGNGDTVLLKDLRALRLPGYRDLLFPFQKWSYVLGFGLIPLSVLNQAIAGDDITIHRPIAIVSGAALLAGTAVWYCRTKRIRIKKNTVVQVISQDFEHLGPGGTGKQR